MVLINEQIKLSFLLIKTNINLQAIPIIKNMANWVQLLSRTIFVTSLFFNNTRGATDLHPIKKLVEPKRYKKAAISTESELASIEAINILKKGGNATDAAITATLCVGVINSFSSGIGGGGFALIANKDKVTSVDFRPVAPEKLKQNFSDYEQSLFGGHSICVPGELKGLSYLHQKFGKLPWEDVVLPAANLALNGFRVSGLLSKRLGMLEKELKKSKYLSDLYIKDGEIIKEGTILQIPMLGNTLLTIANKGVDAFYQGELTEKMLKTLKENESSITADDFVNYRVIERAPVEGTYMGNTVYSTPAPSSGALLIYGLHILENFDLKSLPRRTANHVIIEVMKYIYSKRIHLGDPNRNRSFFNQYESNAISKEVARSIAKKINMYQTDSHNSYKYIPESNVKLTIDHGTMHLSIIDNDSQTISLTSSINHEFGSRVIDPDTGIIFNNDMNDFSFRNKSNYYNLVPGENNYIEPGKRSASSSTPVIIKDSEGGIIMSVGAAGGIRIISSTIQTIVNVLVFNMNARQAVEEKRFHHQYQPDKLEIDINNHEIINELAEIGHDVDIVDPIIKPTSSVQLVIMKDGLLEPAYDNRKKGGICGI